MVKNLPQLFPGGVEGMGGGGVELSRHLDVEGAGGIGGGRQNFGTRNRSVSECSMD